MGFNPNQGFSMPMFNPWVPEKVRPWIYLLFALFFQLSSGVYFGSLQQMVGATGFTREDMVMVAMFGVVGVAALHQSAVAHQCRLRDSCVQSAVIVAHQ